MTTGVLPWAELRRNIMLNTGFFETSQYVLDEQMKIIAGNWDGAGMSAGNLQYNFGPADRLSEFFNHLLNYHESVVRGVFADRTDLFEEFKTVNLTYTRSAKITWANGITDYTKPSPDGHRLLDPWKTILGNLMITPEAYAKYYEMMDAYYIPPALDLFKQMNCFSRASLASFFDLSVNRGRTYPVATLVRDFELIDANSALTDEQKEAEKIRAINIRGNDVTNAMDASASGFVQRRTCQAEQGGTYYGNLYDPEVQFDINQEPAIPEKQAGFGNDVKLGSLGASTVFVGTNPIKSIYLGANLVGNAEIKPYVTNKVPDTQFRTDTNSYLGFESGAVTVPRGKKVFVDVQNYVACKVYYTLDGTTPTENSLRYYDGITFNVGGTFTLKILAISLSGIAQAIKTCTVTVPAFTGWRYVRLIGHGDQTGITTRLVEIQALQGATNRLLSLLPMTGSPAPNGGAIALATNGEKLHATGYPFWWTGEGIPDLKYDLGANYLIDTINVTMYSPATDPRQSQFKVLVSENNTDWTQVVDYSGNTTPQPEAGFNFPVPQG